MILIIDAYNVLKYAAGNTHISQQQRTHFIHRLHQYAQGRKIRPLVIFDSGPSPWPFQEEYGVVTVLYPGSGRSADTAIAEYIEQYAAKDLLLISSDNALRAVADRHTVPSLDAPLFLHIMQRAVDNKKRSRTTASSSTMKLSQESNPALDELMFNVHDAPKKDTDETLDTLINYAGNQDSKAARAVLQKLKKLL